MPVVQVDGLGNVQFPDDMQDDEISKSIAIHQNKPEGMLEKGNIDIANRPIISNPDGSHSSEYSISFGDEQGREILVPTIVNGKFLTPTGEKPPEGSPQEKQMFKRAQQHYEQTHEHLGIFDTPENADAYATAVHNREQAGNKSVKPQYVYTGAYESKKSGKEPLE